MIHKDAIKPVKIWKLMLRGIVQSLSLEVFKTELERAVGNPV